MANGRLNNPVILSKQRLRRCLIDQPVIEQFFVFLLVMVLALSGGSLRYEQSSGFSTNLWVINNALAVGPPERIFKDGFEDPPITLLTPSSGDSFCADDVIMSGSVDDTVVQLLVDGVDTPLTNLQFTSAPVTLVNGSNILVLEAVISGGGSKFLPVSINRIPFTQPVNKDLLDITIPAGPNSTVSGFSLAANAGAKVTITNKRTSASVLVTADSNGGFSTSIAAQSDDELTLVAEETNICPASDTISAVVPDTNQPPTLDAIGNKVVDLGQSLNFTTSGTDTDGDELSFAGFPLPVGASLDAATGEFSFHPVENQAGVFNVTFSVSDGIGDDSETISITVNPAPNAGITKMSGRVVDTTDFVNDGSLTPVVGATVSIMNSGISAVTASDGSFTLSPIPAGEQLFDIHPTGTTAPDGSNYAGFREAITIIDKVDNQHARPFFLPRIAMASIKNVNPDVKTIIRNDVLGVRIEIPPHTAKWIDGSDYDGPMSISEVPDAVAPAALPPNLGFGLLVTIQPVGVYFVSPVPIFFPNGDGLPDGSIVDIWSLDGGTGTFTVVGKAEVVNDELKTVSGGVVSADWHGPLIGGTTQTTDEDPEVCDACKKLKAVTGSKTTLGQGSLSVRHDLVPYQSVGQWRAPSLVYNSTNADARPVVTTKATMPNPRPQRLAVSVSYQGVAGSSEVIYDTSALSTLDQVQLAGQFDASALPSGIYDYALDITNIFAFSSVVTQQAGSAIINNMAGSPMGAGWGIAGLNRLIEQADQSVLMVGGDGSARVYSPLLEGSGKYSGPDVKTIANWTRGKPAIGDINSDNKLDFIVPVSNSTFGWVRLEVYINDGSGGFAYSQFTPVGNPNAIALADFNKDLKLDLIVMDHNGGQIHLGNGLGGFGLPTEFTANAGTERAIVVADFNNDTNLDIAYGNGRVNTKTVSIQLGDGAGGFGAQTHIEIARGRVLDISTNDFNNDNKADILVAADPNTTGWVDVFLGDGIGGFAAPIELPAGTRPTYVDSGDFDLNNTADILVAGGSVVSVIYGNGDGSFAAAETMPLIGFANCVAAGDFDGNGNPDFAVATSSADAVTLFDGNGLGGFPVRRRVNVGTNPSCMVTADFNNDSLDDIVALHGGANARTLSIHLSDGPNNLSGVVAVPAVIPTGGDIVVADFNEDSIPDAAVAKRNNLEVYLGDGESFGLPTSTFVHQDAEQIQQADFNADGHIDLAFFRSSFASKQGIEVRLGDGLGGFETIIRTNYPENEFVSPVNNFTAGDINQDGLPDLVFSSGSVQHKIHAMLGDGTGSFTWVTPRNVVNRAEDLKIVDVMGDAQKEVVAYNWSENVVVFGYDGIGALVSLGPVSKIGVFAVDFDFGDVNGDGIVDVVTVNGSGGLLGKLSVGIGNGDGTFVDLGDVDMCISNSGFNSPVKFLVLADIDNDGDLDATFSCTSNQIIGTALNDGTGVFTKHQELITNGIGDMAIGDFNLDGAIDVVSVANAGLDLHHNIPTANRVGLRSPASDFSVLTPNLDGTYTRREKDGTITEFATSGLQTSVADRNGNTTTYQYDGFDRLTRMVDPVAKETTFAYTGSHLSSITDPVGRVTQFNHDGSGNLTSITDPDTSVRQFDYDSRHRLIKQTSKRGFDTRYDYDEYGANWRAIRPDNSVVVVKPFAMAALPEPGSGSGTSGNPLPATLVDDVFAQFTDGRGGITRHQTNRFGSGSEMTDPLGRSTTLVRNSNNQVMQLTKPDGVSSLFTYDPHGNLSSVNEAQGLPEARQATYSYEPSFNRLIAMVDPAGKVTSYDYDLAGNLLSIIDPLLDEKLFTYLPAGQVATATDRNLKQSSYTYDAAGNVSTFTDAKGQVSHMTNDPKGNIVSIDFAFGTADEITSTFAYDTMNRLVSFSDPSGVTLAFSYDDEGNMATRTYGLGETDLFAYDPLNRVVEMDSTVHGKTIFTYDAEGNAVSSTDARNAVTTYDYDAAGQLIRSVSADGGTESYEYDLTGRMTGLTNAKGQKTSFSFDGLGHVVMVDSPATGVTNLAWDSRDQLSSVTDSEGVQISYDHNELMRLVSMTTPDEVLNYGYDPVGNLTSASDDDSDLQFDYDAVNRVVEARTEAGGLQPVTSLAYQFDSLGNRTQITDPAAGNSMFEHDNAGRLSQVTTTTGEKIDFAHDGAGRLLTITRPNLVQTDRTYDANGRLKTIEHTLNDVSLIDFTDMTLDATGDVSSRETPAGLSSYTYDGVSRLTSATGATTETYTYDVEGNRLTSHQLTNQVYGSGNRLLSNDQFTYTYDNVGRLTSRTEISSGLSDLFVFDAFGHLVELTDRNGLVTTYSYDVLGRRIEKNVDGTVTRFIYDGTNIRSQYDGANTLLTVAEYGDGLDHPVSLLSAGKRYYMNSDQLGSITSVTNDSGAVVNDYVYDAFGNMLAGVQSVDIPWSYTGREFDDESGFYFYRNRYYDPASGRFITPDPLGHATGDSNLYAYVNNDALNLRDPLGLFGESDLDNLIDVANSITGFLPGQAGLVSDIFGLLRGSASSSDAGGVGISAGQFIASRIGGGPAALATLIGVAGKINLEQIGEVELALGELGNSLAGAEGQLIRLRGTLRRNALSRSQRIRLQIIYFLCEEEKSEKRALQRIIDGRTWGEAIEEQDRAERNEMRRRLFELMHRIAEDPSTAPYEVSDIVPEVGRYDPMPR